MNDIIDLETAIAIAILVLAFAIAIVMYWSVKVSKQLSIALFSAIFFGVAVAMIIWLGFTQQAFETIGLMAFALLVFWLRSAKSIADTARARGQLKDKLSHGKYSTCEVCGSKKLTYHKTPKNPGQLLLGGLTCDNCGAEINIPLDVLWSR
jgi:hypothetical protein